MYNIYYLQRWHHILFSVGCYVVVNTLILGSEIRWTGGMNHKEIKGDETAV